MDNKDAFYLVVRYVICLLLGLNSLYIIYKVFTPLTLYTVLFILKAIYSSANLFLNNISFSSSSISITQACIAGAAYYLLIILNLTTPITIKKRVKSLAFLILLFLIINICRIIIFAVLFDKGFRYFDLSHTIAWHIGSTIVIIALWFISIRLFDIKEIPIYSDIKSLYKKNKDKKSKRK